MFQQNAIKYFNVKSGNGYPQDFPLVQSLRICPAGDSLPPLRVYAGSIVLSSSLINPVRLLPWMSVCLWIPFFRSADKNSDSRLKSSPETCTGPKCRLPKDLCIVLLLADGQGWHPQPAGELGAPRILNWVARAWQRAGLQKITCQRENASLSLRGRGKKKSALQCRGSEFDPWSRKIPHAPAQLLNPHIAIREVCTTMKTPTWYKEDPMCHSYN